MADELPPDSLVLQALHAIKAGIDQTNARLDQTNARLDQTNARLDNLTVEVRTGLTEVRAGLAETNQRIDSLREFTVQGLTSLNGKVDHLGVVVERHGNELHELNERLDSFLRGEGHKLVKRVDALEEELRRVAAKIDH